MTFKKVGRLILCNFQTHFPPLNLSDFMFLPASLHSENKTELLQLVMPGTTEQSNVEEPVRSGAETTSLQQMLLKLLNPFQAPRRSAPELYRNV